MLPGIFYLLLGFGLIIVSVAVGNGFVFALGLALAVIGWAFLSRERSERQALAEYRRLMQLITKV